MLLLFGSHEKRDAHLDAAMFHWNRRPGCPAMDMPSKIILPSIATDILAADPDGIYSHIQVVIASPTLTYHVLWLKHHWLESEERRRVRFFAALEHRTEYYAELEAKAQRDGAHEQRMDKIIERIHACGLPYKNATAYVEGWWAKSASEADFKHAISKLEELFTITIYEEPKENQIQITNPDHAEAGTV